MLYLRFLKLEKSDIFQHFSFNEKLKFKHEKSFITSSQVTMLNNEL